MSLGNCRSRFQTELTNFKVTGFVSTSGIIKDDEMKLGLELSPIIPFILNQKSSSLRHSGNGGWSWNHLEDQGSILTGTLRHGLLRLNQLSVPKSASENWVN